MYVRWLNALLCTGLFVGPLLAVDVPGVLPDPDTNPPSGGKVQVYILSGQSNMVGFGQLSGARPVYPKIYLSADPSILPGRMPVGPAGLLPHGLYQSDAEAAPAGAKAWIYRGAYNADADYDGKKAVREATFALGDASAELPAIEGVHTVVAKAYIEVPMRGAYTLHAGFGDSSYAVVALDGQEVYRKDVGSEVVLTKVELEQGQRYPITVTYQRGGSAAFWLELTDLKGKGDLLSLTQAGKFPWFVDAEGKWTTRNDVTYWETRITSDERGRGGPLTVTSNGRFIGPEVPFGYVMGTYHDEPVLLIESSMGNRSLGWDFRPPSSGRTQPDSEHEGFEYRALVEGVRKTLANIADIVPAYAGQGYEIAGFAWWQGHKDAGMSKAEYEQHLVHLIQDLRKDLEAPQMRAAVATVGFSGKNMSPEYQEIHAAQMAVGDPEQHPEFAGQVASVDTRGFWRPMGFSPTGTGYHYNHNAETFVLTGDALGRAMVALMGGTAAELELPARPAMHPDVELLFSDNVISEWVKPNKNPTAAQYQAMTVALRPIVLDRMIPEFIETAFSGNARRLSGLLLADLVKGTRPQQYPANIKSQLDTLMSYYAAAGIDDYGWHVVDPQMEEGSWHYYSFDPSEMLAPDKSDRYRKITYPDGMQNWMDPAFDPAAAGWQQGHAPFGQRDGKLLPAYARCYQPLCGCNKKPATLWEKEVLLMRQTFDLPPAKDGHAYRFILGGAGCDRTGEGFAIYVNGKLLTEIKGGYFKDPGIRGAYLYADTLPELKEGKVTIAIINFLRYTHYRNRTAHGGRPIPPRGSVRIWLEEARLPPAVLQAAAE